MSYYGTVPNRPDQSNPLSSADVALEVRQHPQHALVTPENKEKTRKPIDPPPIVQLKVHNQKQRDWLVNPFLFMNAVVVSAESNEHGQPKTLQGNQLLGQNVSSLHRLKDIDNKDGGFFVFGDISCRRTGVFRLQFNLFDYEKEGVNFLSSAISEPFRVMSAKEYPGLQESTHLSRTFSDQGVRLRLRKENRSAGTKRTYTASSSTEVQTNDSPYSGGPVHSYSYDQDRTFVKRQRSDEEYKLPHAYPTGQYAGSAMPQYGMPNHMQSSNAAYGQEQPQSSQADPVSYPGSMMTNVHQSLLPSWQRSPASYPAPLGGSLNTSSGSYLSGGLNSSQPLRGSNYPQHTSPQYGSRGSTDLFAGMSSMPTPVSEQNMGSAQSSSGSFGQHGQLGGALPSRGQSVQQFGLSQPSSQYPPHTAPSYSQPHQTYQPIQAYHLPASSLGYDQQNVVNAVKHEGSNYGDSPTLYNTPAHNTYPGGETFSGNDLSLSTGVLNREFPGAYEQQRRQEEQRPQYSHIPESDLTQYHQDKSQQIPAYPTPQQTSPTQLQDHG